MDSEEKSLNESQIIKIARELASKEGVPLRVPLGDDAAVVDSPKGLLLLTTDMICEGVHFDLRDHSYYQVGWKGAVAAVSDIAAMGGEPLYCLVAMGFGSSPQEDEVLELFSGIQDALRRFGGSLVGGDTTRSSSGLSLGVTVVGSAVGSRTVTRSGARIRDIIGVTGVLGRSVAGLFLLQREDEDLLRRFPGLVKAHLVPYARVGEGMILARLGVTAMEDISDGLTVELSHICEESRCGCLIDADRLPLSAEVRTAAVALGEDPLEWALGGGEDFELVFTCGESEFESIRGRIEESGTEVTAVGEIMEPERGLKLLEGNKEREIAGYGYEHFG